MNFLKQLLFLLVLVAPITCMSRAIPNEPIFMSMMSDDHKQDISSIVKVIGKALESELTFINVDDDKDDAFNQDVDYLIQAGQFLQQKLPVIVTKVSNAVKHDLTKNQQAIVIDLLHNLQTLSAFIRDNFMVMAEGYSVYEENKALEKHAPELVKKIEDSRSKDLTQEEYILLTKELEEVDLHNESFNLWKRFMCQCCYVIDIGFMANIDLGDDKSALPLQKCCMHLAQVIALVFNDVPGWEKEFEKTANIFLMVNSLSSALLQSIENQ